MEMKILTILTIALTASALTAAEPFTIEHMPNPPGVDPQIGGLDVRADGTVVAAFHRGEVMTFDPKTETWLSFAEGLQEPLGLIVDKNGDLLIMQRAELTRLRDANDDGRADQYITVFDDFGMSGNYHEFAFGPARGPDGSLYIGLNVASNGAGIRPEIRGEWSEIGELSFEEMIHKNQWGKRKGKAGRMYARVEWRGWILKVSPDGSKMEPFASGFRSPDGLGFDADGRLFMTDNQGDWRGTSPLYHVKKGHFYGHPASLVWRNDWDHGDPLKLPIKDLQQMRTLESARFPQGDLANSPTEPALIPDTWGPLAGQLLIGEMNQPRLVRYMHDEVDGFVQGTLVAMFDGTSLGRGNHRLAFADDGTLWIGKTHLSWAGAEGLVKITPQAIDDLFVVTSVKLEKTNDGHVFRIGFSHPLKSAETPNIKHFDYKYHVGYGSPKINAGTLQPGDAKLAKNNRELIVPTPVAEGAIHEINLASIRSKSGTKLNGPVLYYQATRLPK